MSDFNWQTDESTGWDDEPISAEKPTPSRRWLGWLALPLICVVLGSSGWLGWQRLQNQVDAVEEEAIAELETAFMLVQRAADSADVELFTNNLSGIDRAWSAEQQQIVAAGQWLERDAYGLTRLPDEPEIVDVIMAPDMRSAELIIHVNYTLSDQPAAAKVVTLSHAFVMRRGENRWLFAPPTDTFWGESIDTSLATDFAIRLAGEPARDHLVVRRLEADLNAIYQQVCQLNNTIGCMGGGDISFVRVPVVQQRAALTPSRSFAGTEIVTPTLFGHPTDDLSYHAMLRGYAQTLLPLFLPQAEPDQAIDWAMAQLDLLPWSLNEATAPYTAASN